MVRSLSKQAGEKALTAAVEVLSECGVDGFTVDEVSRRSGVAKSTIYRHWASGAELLLKALDQFVTPFPTPNTGSLHGDLTAFFESLAPFMEQEPTGRLILSVLNASAADPEFERVNHQLMSERRQPMLTMLQLAGARGELRSGLDLDLAIDLMEGPFFLHMVVRSTPLQPESVTALIDLVVVALTTPAA